MATSTARRKRKCLTACDSQVQSEVWIPQLFTPLPTLTFILKLIVIHIYCIGLITHFLFKYSCFVILLSISYLIFILALNPSILGRVQMNVVPRSTGNTNSGTRELTLKCKLKCYFKPMNNTLGISPSKGKQGTT